MIKIRISTLLRYNKCQIWRHYISPDSKNRDSIFSKCIIFKNLFIRCTFIAVGATFTLSACIQCTQFIVLTSHNRLTSHPLYSEASYTLNSPYLINFHIKFFKLSSAKKIPIHSFTKITNTIRSPILRYQCCGRPPNRAYHKTNLAQGRQYLQTQFVTNWLIVVIVCSIHSNRPQDVLRIEVLKISIVYCIKGVNGQQKGLGVNSSFAYLFNVGDVNNLETKNNWE
jgi:hypothetical protein